MNLPAIPHSTHLQILKLYILEDLRVIVRNFNSSLRLFKVWFLNLLRKLLFKQFLLKCASCEAEDISGWSSTLTLWEGRTILLILLFTILEIDMEKCHYASTNKMTSNNIRLSANTFPNIQKLPYFHYHSFKLTIPSY